jgi:hypothetical protein
MSAKVDDAKREVTLEDSRDLAIELRAEIRMANSLLEELHTILDKDLDIGRRPTEVAAGKLSEAPKAPDNLRIDLHQILNDCLAGDQGIRALDLSLRQFKVKLRREDKTPPKSK